jgi:primary-amine oxidase
MFRRGSLAVAILAITPVLSLAATTHPLDGLSAAEYWSVFEGLKASGKTDAKTRYAGITLHEPPKSEVLRWKPGQACRREALAVVKQGRKTYEAVVDAVDRKIVSWKELKDVEPNLILEEIELINDKIKEDPEFQAAMKRRGITDYDTLFCDGGSPGYFGTPEEKGRRLQRVGCGDIRGSMNRNARPVEGLMVVWDSEDRKVLRVIDTGAVPVPRGDADYDTDSVGPLREIAGPITIQQPLGPGFKLEGHDVSWQNWKFHFRTDPRVGLVVSNVTYTDGGRDRQVMYEGSLSEIFVPYMDPSEGWYHWTYIDAGEDFNLNGGLATPLEPGTDCPANAVYFDAVFANARAIPMRRQRTACLFEREPGDFAWRHQVAPDQIESRKRRDLVLRMMITVGNYDYGIDWTFLQNGSIKVSVAATGIMAVKAVKSRTALEDKDGKDGAYGRFVAENTVAVNHDHFFSFRLDLDVDGQANSFVKDELKLQELPAEHPRKSIWVAKSKVAATESDAQLHVMMDKPAAWRVVNPSVRGPFGYPVSYQIQPGHNAISLLLPDDYPRRRASFIDHHLWVTPYRDDERYAAGDYPTQSRGGAGLAEWTKQNRAIENTDIVVWYTMGFHHLPRTEDWPVMPTAWHEFEIRPFDFFGRNPALDLPR